MGRRVNKIYTKHGRCSKLSLELVRKPQAGIPIPAADSLKDSQHQMSHSFSFDLDGAIALALQKIDANLVMFAEAYPHDTTLGNIYAPRKLGPYW